MRTEKIFRQITYVAIFNENVIFCLVSDQSSVISTLCSVEKREIFP